jgi:thymidylate synthase
MIIYHDKEYTTLVNHILNHGTLKPNRTGVDTIGVFSYQMRFDMSDGTIPLLTTKKVHVKSIIHELLWMISGSSNIKYLKDNGITIWDEWATPEGHLNKVYGFQWRKWEVNDWMSNVVEVPVGIEGIDAYFIPPKNDLLQPVAPNGDEFIGKKIQTFFGDWFTVISKTCKPGDKNSQYTIQFETTTTILTVLRPALRTAKITIRDPYRISVCGQGCLGVYVEQPPLRIAAYNLWYNMMRRCYDSSLPEYYLYGGRGVFVDQSWRCFANFLRDIHDLVYFTKWAANPSQYDLDKDYFCASSYSKDTCIFLPSKYNQALPNLDGCKYIATHNPSGNKYEFTIQRLFAKQHHIKHSQTISTALLTSPNKQTGVWKFEKVSPRPGHVFRQQFFVDQIAQIINKLKNNPLDRRLIVSAWNVADLPQMNLPPCHYAFQFYTRPLEDGKYELSLMVNQRSCDVGLGVPFNIVQYAFMLRMFCEIANMVPGELIWNGGDTHIYVNHALQLERQILRQPFPSPTFKFARKITDIDDFKYEDFIVEDYISHPAIKMDVAV